MGWWGPVLTGLGLQGLPAEHHPRSPRAAGSAWVEYSAERLGLQGDAGPQDSEAACREGVQGRGAHVQLSLQERCKVQGCIEPHYSVMHHHIARGRTPYAGDAAVALPGCRCGQQRAVPQPTDGSFLEGQASPALPSPLQSGLKSTAARCSRLALEI